MNWKKFFSPSSGKAMIFCTFMALGSVLWYLTHIGVSNPASKAGITFAYLFNAIAPFYTYPSGWIWNILYFYILACIFSYTPKRAKKKDIRKIQNIGVAVFLVMMCFGVASFHRWNDSYIGVLEYEMPDWVDPYGSDSYPEDFETLKDARLDMNKGDFISARAKCEQISPKAAFNDGDSIRDFCIRELNDRVAE